MPGGARNGRPRPSGAPWIIRTFWDMRPFARELQQDFRNDICGFESSQPGTIRLLPPVMNGIMTDEDLNFIGPIAPVKLFSRCEGRCSAKLLFGNFKSIGTVFRIVFQRSPWNGKVFLTEAFLDTSVRRVPEDRRVAPPPIELISFFI